MFFQVRLLVLQNCRVSIGRIQLAYMHCIKALTTTYCIASPAPVFLLDGGIPVATLFHSRDSFLPRHFVEMVAEQSPLQNQSSWESLSSRSDAEMMLHGRCSRRPCPFGGLLGACSFPRGTQRGIFAVTRQRASAESEGPITKTFGNVVSAVLLGGCSLSR